MTSGMLVQRRADAHQVVVRDRIDDGDRRRLRPAAREARADRRCTLRDHVVAPPGRPCVCVCACSTRTRLASVIGVSGWLRMPLSLSSTSPTNRWPLKTVRWLSGNAGHGDREAAARQVVQRIDQRIGDGADVALRRAVEGRAVLEVDLLRALRTQPAQRGQRLRHRVGRRDGARLERDDDGIGIDRCRRVVGHADGLHACACRRAPGCWRGRSRR